ncbi:MAG TPA: hypothetical protein VET23_08400 [Chitinophagaceae bacterium]|nr:hypothetical protein [Chitinophagaceae bacterium]
MKKIFFALQVMSTTALFAPVYAGMISKTNRQEVKTENNYLSHRRKKEISTDWVNYETRQQFYSDFPNATNVEWRRTNFEEASFTDGPVSKTAYYDNNNTLVGTINEVSYSGISEKARKEIQKDYPSYKVAHAIFFKDNPDNDSNMFLYSTSFDDGDSYFAELSKGAKSLILKINMADQVSFFQNL